eukprot:2190718-Rhodomonas_salina.2
MASAKLNLALFFSLPAQVFVILLLEGLNSYRNFGISCFLQLLLELATDSHRCAMLPSAILASDTASFGPRQGSAVLASTPSGCAPPVLFSSSAPVLQPSNPPVLLSSYPPILLSSPPILRSSDPPVLLLKIRAAASGPQDSHHRTEHGHRRARPPRLWVSAIKFYAGRAAINGGCALPFMKEDSDRAVHRVPLLLSLRRRSASSCAARAAVYGGDATVCRGNAAICRVSAFIFGSDAAMDGGDTAIYGCDAVVDSGDAAMYGSDEAINGGVADINGGAAFLSVGIYKVALKKTVPDRRSLELEAGACATRYATFNFAGALCDVVIDELRHEEDQVRAIERKLPVLTRPCDVTRLSGTWPCDVTRLSGT